MLTRKTAYRDIHRGHYRVVCPRCGEEWVVNKDEIQLRLFEPHEKAYKYWQGGIGPEYEKTETRLVSSDPSKDIYTIKCEKCGHVWDELAQGMYSKRCNPDGEKCMTFELSEKETLKAEAFMEKHNHVKELAKMGRLSFTALGQQFTFTITPGGLGAMVSIECNFCHEKEDITCTEDW